MILYSIVQIILAILLVFLLLFVANIAYNYESVVNMQNAYTVRKEIVIFDGYTDFANTKWAFNTYNKSLASFKDLTPSINQNGGAEYTYNFWLYLDKQKLESKFTDGNDIVLLLRGSKIQLPYINENNCQIRKNGKYILVKNPLIRLQNNGNAIIVEYNTVTNPDSYRENGKTAINCNGTWFDKNKGMLGIYQMTDPIYNKKWFMFTVVLQEINPDNDILYKNKTSCKIYINGINVMERIVESPYDGSYGSAAMKHNRGPLYVNPGDIYNASDSNPLESADHIKMANLSYFNYALSEADILNLFNKKFTEKVALISTDNEASNILENKFAISPVSEHGNNLPLPF